MWRDLIYIASVIGVVWVETGVNQPHFLSCTAGILVPGWTGAQLVSRGRVLCPALPVSANGRSSPTLNS